MTDLPTLELENDGFSPTRRSRCAGFTLIELLMVTAIIGIISAIAIPRLLAAIEKAKQKRTMADMRTIAGAIEYYAVDFNMYPNIGDQPVAALTPYLTPDIIKLVPDMDGWHHPMEFSGLGGTSYTLVSFGRNLAPDLPYIIGPTSRYRDDIVYSSGTFLQWPDGTQKDD